MPQFSPPRPTPEIGSSWCRRNRSEMVTFLYAAPLAGVVAAFGNMRLHTEEIRAHIDDVGPTVLVGSDDQLSRLAGIGWTRFDGRRFRRRVGDIAPRLGRASYRLVVDRGDERGRRCRMDHPHVGDHGRAKGACLDPPQRHRRGTQHVVGRPLARRRRVPVPVSAVPRGVVQRRPRPPSSTPRRADVAVSTPPTSSIWFPATGSRRCRSRRR